MKTKKAFPILLFLAIASIASTAVLANMQTAYAGNGCNSFQNGPWEVGSTWVNCSGPGGIPGNSENTAIDHRVTISSDVVNTSTVRVDLPNGVLIVNKAASLTVDNFFVRGDAFNHGEITVLDSYANGEICTFTNECTGVLNLNGGTNNEKTNGSPALFINHGRVNINGIDFINIGTFQNSGIINPFGKLITQAQGEFETIPSPCQVGGKFLEVDNTALLLAGIQTNLAWIVPVVLASAGFAAYKLKRK